jgi:hypothetical protein
MVTRVVVRVKVEDVVVAEFLASDDHGDGWNIAHAVLWDMQHDIDVEGESHSMVVHVEVGGKVRDWAGVATSRPRSLLAGLLGNARCWVHETQADERR